MITRKYTAHIRFTILLFCVRIGIMQPPPSPIIINGCRPLAIIKADFSGSCALRASVSVLSTGRAAANPFVKILRQGGRGCTLLIDTLSVETFYADLLEGKCQPAAHAERAQERG